MPICEAINFPGSKYSRYLSAPVMPSQATGRAEGAGNHGQGQEEVRVDRRVGGRALTDPVKMCFECHQAKKDQDYVYSTYIP
jgi:hypothetical protein